MSTEDYLADELDLLAFYLDRAFNLGSHEDEPLALNLGMKSKELDPYFTARAAGVSVEKPAVTLSSWWRDLLDKVEQRCQDRWTEVCYVLCSAKTKYGGRWRSRGLALKAIFMVQAAENRRGHDTVTHRQTMAAWRGGRRR